MGNTDETDEVIPSSEELRILFGGFYGAAIGGAIYGVLLSAFICCNEFYWQGLTSGPLLVPVILMLVAFPFFLLVGGIFYLLTLMVDDFTGDSWDLRAMAVLAACLTVYAPFSVFFVNENESVIRLDFFSFQLKTGAFLLLLIPAIAMLCVSVGAWVGADREYQKLSQCNRRTRVFELKSIFTVTLILAAVLTLTRSANIDMIYWLVFIGLMVPVSLVTTVVVWSRRFWPKKFRG